MPEPDQPDLEQKLSTTAFSFRGYNVENLGRTKELLADAAYGPTVRKHLDQASEMAADALRRRIDLAERVFGPDVGTLKGKITRKDPLPMVTDQIELPPEIYEEHESWELCMDVMFVNSIPYLTSRKLY